MMSERDSRILSEFSTLVRGRFPEARIWAFGSRARGEHEEYSDFDVCVVVSNLDEKADQAIMDIAWRVGFDHGVVISSVTYSREEFEEGPCSKSSLVKTILARGLAA